MQWFYADQGKSIGPVEENEFQNLVASGKITPNTLVWHDGMPEWVKYETIRPKSDVVMAQVGGTEAPAMAGLGETPNKEIMARARESLSGNWGMAIAACVLTQLIVSAFFIPYLNILTTFLLSGPFTVGLSLLFITVTRRQEEAQFSMMFGGFHRFGTSLLAFILLFLLYLFWIIVISLGTGIIIGLTAFVFKSMAFTVLVSVLIAIPFIRILLSYLMTFFVIADNTEIGGWEAIRRSTRIMDGVRWTCFCLYLRFIPWMLLVMAPFVLMFPLLIKVALAGVTSPADIMSTIGGAVIYFIAAMLWSFIGSLFLTPYIWAALACFYNDIKDRSNG